MIPDRRSSDTFFASLLSDRGDLTNYSRLSGKSITMIRRQADEEDAEHPSDQTRAEELVFFMTIYNRDKGAAVVNRIQGVYSAALALLDGRVGQEVVNYFDLERVLLDVFAAHGHAPAEVYLKTARLCQEFTQSLNGHRAAQVSSGDLGR